MGYVKYQYEIPSPFQEACEDLWRFVKCGEACWIEKYWKPSLSEVLATIIFLSQLLASAILREIGIWPEMVTYGDQGWMAGVEITWYLLLEMQI